MSQKPDAPRFDPSLPHHQKPFLRRVRCFPAEAEGQHLIGLSDARQISDKMVFASVEAQHFLPHFNGQNTLEQICERFGPGLGLEQVREFVAQLDHAGLLEGPTFERMLQQVRADFEAAPNLPPAATAVFTDMLIAQKLGREPSEDERVSEAAGVMRTEFDQWISKALEREASPRLGVLPHAIIAPHVDYPRGWLAYAAIWGRMQGGPRPDRIVILGTNHFGIGTGVTICDKGYETALGTSPVDAALLGALTARLGPDNAAKALEHRYDHEREHSIELQIPWLQHCFGAEPAIPVLGVLIHDPIVNQSESYDGKGLGLTPFVEAMRLAAEDVGGKTLFVSSADLSHVGPMFGDAHPVIGDEPPAKEARDRVIRHDQEMMAFIAGNKPDELLTSMTWQQNPTRWCSIGNIVATLQIVRPAEVRFLRYVAAMDPEGMGIVTSASAILN